MKQLDVPKRKKAKVALRGHYVSRKRKCSLNKAREARWSDNQSSGSTISTPATTTSTTTSTPVTATTTTHTPVTTATIGEPSNSINLDGSRIVNMDELGKGIKMLTKHSAMCGGECTVQGETMHSGLAVVLSAVCSKCKQVLTINTSKRLTMNDKTKKWSVNVAAVLSQMSTGGGLSRLNNTLATMDVPGMTKCMYTATERYLGEEMKQQLIGSKGRERTRNG